MNDNIELTQEEVDNINAGMIRKCLKQLADLLAEPLVKRKPQEVFYLMVRPVDDDSRMNIVGLQAHLDTWTDDETTFQVDVFRARTDRFYTSYVFEAGKTQSDILKWINNTDVCVPVILEYAKVLSDKVDNFWEHEY